MVASLLSGVCIKRNLKCDARYNNTGGIGAAEPVLHKNNSTVIFEDILLEEIVDAIRKLIR